LLDWNITGTELAFAGETGGGASSESWIEIWNIPTRQQQFIYDNGYIITDLRWSPADPHLLALTGVVNNFGNEVVVVDIETGRPRWRVIDVSAGVAYLDWDQSASRLGIVVNRQLQGRVEIRNAENGLLITSLLNGSERVTGIDWSPSAFFVVTGGQQGVIRAGDTYEVVYQLEDASLVRWSNQGDIAYRVSSQEVRITQALAAIKIPTVTP
jgi:WD40 repeat protein